MQTPIHVSSGRHESAHCASSVSSMRIVAPRHVRVRQDRVSKTLPPPPPRTRASKSSPPASLPLSHISPSGDPLLSLRSLTSLSPFSPSETHISHSNDLHHLSLLSLQPEASLSLTRTTSPVSPFSLQREASFCLSVGLFSSSTTPAGRAQSPSLPRMRAIIPPKPCTESSSRIRFFPKLSASRRRRSSELLEAPASHSSSPASMRRRGRRQIQPAHKRPQHADAEPPISLSRRLTIFPSLSLALSASLLPSPVALYGSLPLSRVSSDNSSQAL